MTILQSMFLYAGADIAWKSTIMLAWAAVIAGAARRAPASFRHLIWTLGLVLAMVLPLLSASLPTWRTRAPAMRLTNASPAAQIVDNTPTLVQAPLPDHLASKTHAPTVALSEAAALPRNAAPHSISWPWLMLAVWIVGAVWTLFRMARSVTSVRRLERASQSVSSGPLAGAVDEIVRTTPGARNVQVRQDLKTDWVRVPMTWGWLHPVILFPRDASEWPRERVMAALLHEMAHIRRGDWATLIVARTICAVYWWNPLAWFAAQKMHETSEAACDDLVILNSMSACDYARQLLDVALAARTQGHKMIAGAISMARTPHVEGRLRAVLANGRARRPMTIRPVLMGAAIALIAALPLAALRLAAKTPPMPIPEADHIQLHDGFALRYAVTITDLKTPEQRREEYQMLLKNYRFIAAKFPKEYSGRPIPEELKSFSTFNSSPSITHKIVNICARNGRLVWREESNRPNSIVYDGRSTQWFHNGREGGIYSGLDWQHMVDCPLPGVGLPYVPLLKETKLVETSGTDQTWEALSPLENGGVQPKEIFFEPAQVHAIYDRGTWKILSVDTGLNVWEFSRHQKFQGLWIASRLRRVTYSSTNPVALTRMRPKDAKTFLHVLQHARRRSFATDYQLLSLSDQTADWHTEAAQALTAEQMRAAETPTP